MCVGFYSKDYEVPDMFSDMKTSYKKGVNLFV